jgi:hypothetical protein
VINILPDYPTVKKGLEKKFVEIIENEIKKDPLISRIRFHQIHEGDVLTTSTIDGYSDTTDYKLLTSKFGIQNDEIIEKGFEAIFSKIPEIAKDIIKQQSKLIIETVDKATQRTGNIVNGKGQSLSPELILEGLKNIAIDFDEFGNPIYPILWMPQDQFEKIKDKIPEWEKNPEFKKKQKEIIEEKRQEWIDRQNSRKLVD